MRTALLSATCLLSLCTSAIAGPLTKAETAELMVWQQRSVFEHDAGVAEKARIASNAANVRKSVDTLSLKLRDKGWHDFRFKPIPEDESTVHGFNYVFLTHVASKHGYLVGITYYEGLDYLWIDDRNGEMTQFCCIAPIFSPDGNRVLVLGSDLEGQDSEYTRLYQLRDHRLVLEKKWLLPPETGGPVHLVSWTKDALRLKLYDEVPENSQPFTLDLSTGSVQ